MQSDDHMIYDRRFSFSDVSASLSEPPAAIDSLIAISALKRLSFAKSRLNSPELSADLRQELVLAMLHDTHTALEPIIQTHYIISPDPAVRNFAQTIGCIALEEDLLQPSLNLALETALDQAQSTHPHSHIILIQPDLPAISVLDIQKITRLIPQVPLGIVTDWSNTGTTMLSFAPGQRIRLQFGLNSAQKHQMAGAQLFAGPWDGLDQDVDTLDDLQKLLPQLRQYSRTIAEKVSALKHNFCI